MTRYKDIMVARSSDLAKALEANEQALASKTYKETTARYAAMYSKEDRDWFAMMHNK